MKLMSGVWRIRWMFSAGKIHRLNAATFRASATAACSAHLTASWTSATSTSSAPTPHARIHSLHRRHGKKQLHDGGPAPYSLI
ncbi:hypothetical protein PENSPDRAFT_59769 [Peniophora sp. CONT]|nr:hypothetical protein PENSPDRAFT_59769 [Peniophora sp. CONT]